MFLQSVPAFPTLLRHSLYPNNVVDLALLGGHQNLLLGVILDFLLTIIGTLLKTLYITFLFLVLLTKQEPSVSSFD